MTGELTPGARRVLDAASDLFYDRGLHAVGVDAIAERAGVTKKTLYDRFGSKDALAVTYLRGRDDRWRAVLDAERAEHPAGADRVLALFDAMATWHEQEGGRGCAAINARAETPDPAHPVAQEVTRQKAWLRERLHQDCADAGAADPGPLADALMLVYEGALATSGLRTFDAPAAVARRAASDLLALALADR